MAVSVLHLICCLGRPEHREQTPECHVNVKTAIKCVENGCKAQTYFRDVKRRDDIVTQTAEYANDKIVLSRRMTFGK